MQPTLHTHLEIPQDYVSRPASMDDIPELVALVNAHSQRLFAENEETEANWAAMWQSKSLDLATDTRVLIDRQGKIAATTELWDFQPPYVWKYAYWRVHPDCEDPAPGVWALRWAEQRARQGVDRAPLGARVVVSSRIPEKDRYSVETFLACDYQPVRRMDRMRMPLDQIQGQPASPDGFEIRAVQNDQDLDNLLFALWESFQDHWGHVPEPLDSFVDRFKTYLKNDPDLDPSLCLLVVASGQPVGGDICKRMAFGEPGMGWINLLGVRRAWRKHGIGKALLQHSFSLLQSIGMRQVGLDVDSENITGALRLYESVGLRTVRRAVTYLNELRPGNDLTVHDSHDAATQD